MPLFNKFTPLAEGSLRDRLFALARRTNFPTRSIDVMDGSKRSRHSNAFFTGFGRFRKVVLFDTLVAQLTEPELEAVLAHEIGHIALDHKGTVMHRDRPIFQLETASRDQFEQEADYFAACFLAPDRLVNEEFQKRFCSKPPLPLTDAVAFHLCGESAHALMRAGPNSFKFAAAVASARTFNTQHFKSLAEVFCISVGAMAIRLRELKLVED